MKIMFKCATSAGVLYIGQSTDGRFHSMYNGESLGSYANANQAADDLANGSTSSVLHQETMELLDTATLGIPDSALGWRIVH